MRYIPHGDARGPSLGYARRHFPRQHRPRMRWAVLILPALLAGMAIGGPAGWAWNGGPRVCLHNSAP
jgi:hypothetical protein